MIATGDSDGFAAPDLLAHYGRGDGRGHPDVSRARNPSPPDRGPEVSDPEPGRDHGCGLSAGSPAAGPDDIDHDVDPRLIARVRAGDVDAYDALIRRHRDRIYRIALRMMGDRQDAEDVAQEVVIQLWTAVAGFNGAAMFTTWLYRVVVNRCVNHQRRARHVRPLTDADHPSAPGADEAVIARHRAQATVAAIGALPSELRVTLVLCQLEALSHREVADILEVSEPVVRGRLSRARRILQAQLRDWT